MRNKSTVEPWYITIDNSAQSGLESSCNVLQTGNTKSQNMMFADQADDYTCEVKTYSEGTRTGQDASDADLANFFSRPLKIATYEWGTNTVLAQAINPWQLFFNNPRVANRVANFNLLRCNLHVKILINGNGFLYGRAMASYLPMSYYDVLSIRSGVIEGSLVQQSQWPHVFLDPTLSRGGELILPFFYYKNNMSIPDENWIDMGSLIIRSLTELKHANGASGDVTISVFAWAENVHLNVLTSREQTSMLPQMGSEIDKANKDGVVSGPATTVASVARELAKIPLIAPYALATEAAATAVARTARLLGYSRPPITKAPDRIQRTYVSSMALTTVPELVEKLTIDDKQELTIDPIISGIGPEDPLIITNISTRESYLTSFTWPVGTAPEALLWNTKVTPITWHQTGDIYYFPACAMAALPFRYWTGTLKFRFQVISSSFHKGRLKVVYDPQWVASTEYNINYMEVIDIADKSDFTIAVSNGQPETLIDHHTPGVDPISLIYSTTPYSGQDYGNGVLAVYVVNELTVPNSTVNNDVKICVYISTGDDFEVFVPEENFNRFVFKQQSGLEVADSENTNEKDAPEHQQSTALGDRYDDFANINKVYVGETIKSFRPLLKRYNLHATYGARNASNQCIYVRTPMFPYLRGKVTGAVNVTTAGQPYNYCNTVLLHWVTYAFSGWRGSIRRKIIVKGRRDVGAPLNHFVERAPLPGYDFTVLPAISGTTLDETARLAIPGSGPPNAPQTVPPFGWRGMAVRNGFTNDSLEVESPFYSNERFNPGKVEDWTSASSTFRRNVESLELKTDVVGDATTIFCTYVAAGEDYQVYFFTGLPPMYYEANPPA